MYCLHSLRETKLFFGKTYFAFYLVFLPISVKRTESGTFPALVPKGTFPLRPKKFSFLKSNLKLY